MKVGFVRVVENERLYGDTYVMWLAPGSTAQGADLAAGATPGQFLMLRCAGVLDGHDGVASGASLGDDPLLPRAMSYHRIRRGDPSVGLRAGPSAGLRAGHGPEFSILYDVVGRGTAWLAARRPGDEIYAWGPLGRGYSLRQPGDNLLLVGGGIGIAPLLWLADEAVAKGKSVVLIDGARDQHGVFPAHLVPPEVEVVVTTQDGSAGRKGLVTDIFLDYYGWADQVFTCGPNPMFAALADVLRAEDPPASSGRAARRRKPVQALLESPMGCGTGICYGCAVMDRRDQPRLVCKEGPRFELREIW